MSFPSYPAYKDSGTAWLEEVPRDWSIERLKYVARIIPSNVDKHSNPGEVEVRLCNYTDVYYRDTVTSDLELMRATASPDQTHRFKLLAGDVVITKDSETPDDIAVPAFVPASIPSVLCGYHLSIIRPRGPAVGRFLYYWFMAAKPRAYFEVAARGLTRVGLSQGALGGTPLGLPSRDEQTRIVEVLDQETARIDALIGEQQRLIELLQEKRQAVISHAVSKGLNPDVLMKDSGVEWLGEVPAHWQVCAIKHLSPVLRGASPRPIDDPIYFDTDGAYGWVRISDVTAAEDFLESTEQKLSALGASLSVKREPGDLILSIAGTVGKPCITKIKCCIHDGFVYFPMLKINPMFLFYIFDAGQAYKGLGKMGTQLNLNTDTVGGIKVARPPDEEVEKIVSYLNQTVIELNSLMAEAETRTALLRERRSTLISAAVTGKIDVRDWKPQNAAVEYDPPMVAETDQPYG